MPDDTDDDGGGGGDAVVGGSVQIRARFQTNALRLHIVQLYKLYPFRNGSIRMCLCLGVLAEITSSLRFICIRVFRCFETRNTRISGSNSSRSRCSSYSIFYIHVRLAEQTAMTTTTRSATVVDDAWRQYFASSLRARLTSSAVSRVCRVCRDNTFSAQRTNTQCAMR